MNVGSSGARACDVVLDTGNDWLNIRHIVADLGDGGPSVCNIAMGIGNTGVLICNVLTGIRAGYTRVYPKFSLEAGG